MCVHTDYILHTPGITTNFMYCFTTGSRCLKMKQKLRNYLKPSKKKTRKRRNIKVCCYVHVSVDVCVGK